MQTHDRHHAYTISQCITLLKDAKIKMIDLDSHLYLFIDGIPFFVNDTAEGVDNYFVPMNGVQNREVTSVGVYNEKENMLWVSSTTSIYLYKINKLQFTVISEIKNFTEEVFSAVMMEPGK